MTCYTFHCGKMMPSEIHVYRKGGSKPIYPYKQHKSVSDARQFIGRKNAKVIKHD